MMPSDQSLLLAALLTVMANAQTTTVVNDPLDPAVSTVYFSVCPTAATTTVTLPTTLTFCPGEYCPGGGPTITPPPALGDAEYTSTLLHVTFTGTDGKVTELAEYITVFDAPCTSGPGMCQATYTVTEECPCHTRDPAYLPSHFTTTIHTCSACGPGGSPMEITQTVPCSTASYSAEVNPAGAGAYASTGAQVSAGAYASAGAGAPGAGGAAAAGANGQGAASAGAANGSNVANAAAGVDAGAAAQAGSNNAVAGTGAGAGAGAQGAGSGSGSGSGSAGANGVGAGVGQGDVANAQAGNGTSPPITGYTGAADRTMFAVSTLFIAVVGSLAWIL